MPRRNNTVTVTEGTVLVDSVHVERSSRSLLVLMVNTRTKYPNVLGVGGLNIFLYPSEYALHKGEGDEATMLRLPERCRGWEILPEHTGRYSLLIAAWRKRRDRGYPLQVWVSPVDHYKGETK